MNSYWKGTVLLFFVIIFDQITKGFVQAYMYLGQSITIVDGLFNITSARNTGAAFGMGSNSDLFWRRIFFLLIPVLACFWLLKLIRDVRSKSQILFYAYILILGGAIGNLIDRFSLGYVVDFFDFYIHDSHFATFNIADSSITIAAFMIIFDFILELNQKKIEISEKN